MMLRLMLRLTTYLNLITSSAVKQAPAGEARRHQHGETSLRSFTAAHHSPVSERRGNNLNVLRLFPESDSQNLALTVFCVPFSLESEPKTTRWLKLNFPHEMCANRKLVKLPR